jgi:hypothetical protein
MPRQDATICTVCKRAILSTNWARHVKSATHQARCAFKEESNSYEPEVTMNVEALSVDLPLPPAHVLNEPGLRIKLGPKAQMYDNSRTQRLSYILTKHGISNEAAQDVLDWARDPRKCVPLILRS